MSFPFNTNNLLESTEEEIKVLMAIIIQNSLMIQQLQLMVVVRQKEMEEKEQRKESHQQKKRKVKEKEVKQKKLREEKIRMMRGWNEKKSQEYVESFRGYKEDTRYKKCGWFGHIAQHCKKKQKEVERE